ncbi:hypothetical protein [Paenirhodobacter populi]|uniref:hypothetical protein n=1 Tax=Paenirhodobacter populi TaxID=2306993 RepID=UPI000FE34437|nr:hypothetical protein [Sinirhodobacter populi]RWR04189.1 hypothetical protein D2T32_20395 [Sinirhodobacter populi]
MTEVLFAGAFAVAAAILGALITVINQNMQLKKQAEAIQIEQAASSKKSVIEDLVAYRFVLTDKGNHAIPTTHFNVALSKIPVLFGANKKCIELYRAFGNEFTSSKFHDLIVELMKDVPLDTSHISAELLENVPSRRPITGT